MAAEAVASLLLSIVSEKLKLIIEREVGSLCSLKKDLEKLESTLLTIQRVIEDAERQSILRPDVRQWLMKLEDVAYDAEDVLEEYHTDTDTDAMMLSKRACRFFSLENPLAFRLKMAHTIRGIMERLDALVEESKTRFQLSVGVISSTQTTTMGAWRETTSSVDKDDKIYGQDKQREMLVDFLIHMHYDSAHVPVVSITGLGGIGKTTLAKSVFNDDRVRGHFNKLIWVYVSQDLDEKRVMRSAIESVTGSTCDINDMEPLQKRLRQVLSGQKFLLVLDDIWNENSENWERLKSLFTGGAAEGSSILVTTRSTRAASIMGSVKSQHLDGLSHDDCWRLFERRAFGIESTGEVRHQQRLEEIGREIVRKCRGVPLAAKSIGSLMRFKRSESEWVAIRDSEIWKLPEDNREGILPALKLSYSHLPSRVKQCFAYCSLYPKGHLIDKNRLVEDWIAEGFIPIADQSQPVRAEDIATEYIHILLSCSFLGEESRHRVKMHDLVHDLAQSVAADRCAYINVGGEQSIPARCRYLTLHYKPLSVISQSYRVNRNLRSLHLSPPSSSGPTCDQKMIASLLGGQSRLRVLDLSNNWGISSLPRVIGKLKLLRYLNLSKTRIRELPAFICDLRNLRTLILAKCRNLLRLPEAIDQMQKLETLDLTGCKRLLRLPSDSRKNIRNLKLQGCENLRESNEIVSTFIVSKKPKHGIEELRDREVGVSLEIVGLENARRSADAKRANLREKANLQTLKFTWSCWRTSKCNDQDVLEALQPHPNLVRLVIKGYAGSNLPTWMMTAAVPEASLMNLKEVRLTCLWRCRRLPPLGHLPFLETLVINFFPRVTRIDFNSEYSCGTFPSLKSLELSFMFRLVEWSIDEKEEDGRRRRMFPCLEKLKVSGCHALKALPDCILPSLKTLDIEYCHSLRSLPEGLRYLTAITHLGIRGCPILYKKGLNERQGEEWDKIKHIQYIEIGGGDVDALDCLVNCATRLYSCFVDSLC